MNNNNEHVSHINFHNFIFFFAITFVIGCHIFLLITKNNSNKNILNSYNKYSEFSKVNLIRHLEEEKEKDEEENNETEYFNNITETELEKKIIDTYNIEFPFFSKY